MLPEKFKGTLDSTDQSDDEIEEPIQHTGPAYRDAPDVLGLEPETATRMSNFLKANYIREFVDVS